MELKEGIKQINQSVSQSSASDATLEGYMLELKDANGNLVDKQPVSKIESLVYNYLTTKRQSELATAVGGNQNGNADGFVKFINTFIDDTIDEHRPNGIFPLLGESSSNRGFVFRFYSNKHSRAIEIRFVENQFPDFRINTSGQWGEWIQTPYYLKDYPDIASLASGMNKTIKTNNGEHIYKIGSINSNYTPVITRVFVSNTDSNRLTEYVVIVGESTSGIAADGNKVYYRLLANAPHAGGIEFKVANRTIYAVITGDVAVRFEFATEVTGIDLSTAYVVAKQQIN